MADGVKGTLSFSVMTTEACGCSLTNLSSFYASLKALNFGNMRDVPDVVCFSKATMLRNSALQPTRRLRQTSQTTFAEIVTLLDNATIAIYFI